MAWWLKPVSALLLELDDERRRYYRLSEFGRKVARAEAQRLESVLALARAKRLLARAGSA